jgi:hypothetical protein
MTIQEINQLKTQIDQFNAINLEEHFADAFQGQSDFGSLTLNRMKVSDFINLSRRTIKQLEAEISGPNGIVLPFTFSNPEFGQTDVYSNFINYLSYLRAKQFSNAENSLLWMAHYELQNGFFDRSKVKVHSLDALNLENTSSALELLSRDLLNLKKNFKDQLAELARQTKELEDFKAQKESELQQITNNLATANTNNTQIQTLLNASTQSESRITSILSEVEKTKSKVESVEEAINSTLVKFKTEYSELVTKISKSDADFTALYNDFVSKHGFVVSKHQYFVDRNDYLDSLIGREVGASLFETFKQRKTELNGPLNTWRWTVWILGGLTFVMIFAIFTNFFGLLGAFQTAFRWENVLVNALKSLPFFFMLYYAISQYNKERDFQEEYAFKSAAALTIKAYADILTDSKNKDELILKGVFGIYRNPISSRAKNSRDINSAIDMVGELVDKGKGLLSKGGQ